MSAPFFSKLRFVALTAFVAFSSNLSAHNLDTTSTALQYSADFIETMKTRAAAGEDLIQPGDEFWVSMKTTPGPGTTTGVGGYMTFYVPGGYQVADAAYVLPSTTDPRGFANVPMEGQSPIALGAGPVGAKIATGLAGYSYPAPNILGVNEAPAATNGIARGTLAGVYADTGIFYSTNPTTAFNSYGAAPPVPGGGTPPMINNSGDTVGEWFAVGYTTNKLGVMTLWDSYQLRAFGRKDVAPIIDTADGRGNAPWGLASPVAGPQSGYAWAFDFNAFSNNPTTNSATKIQSGITVGPWSRIKYSGSQIANDTPGSLSTTLGNAGFDASSVGYDFSASGPLPTNVNAVRFAIGQLELGRPEYAAVKLKVGATYSASNSIYADAFGGDAGGSSNGKDHLWRYFDPTVTVLTPSVLLQKVVGNPLVAPGGTTYFDITFANTGSTAIPNVVLTDVLPVGLAYLSASPAPSTVSGQTITWNLGGMLPNTIRTIRMFVRATGAGSLVNRVTATSNGTPIAVADDTIDIATRALLRAEKTVTPGTVQPGATVTYTLTVFNEGTGNNGVPLVITDTLPAGFTYGSLLSTTLNGGATAPGVVTVNSTSPSRPVFTVTQGIQAGRTFVARFTANVGEKVPPGTYYNQALLQFEGKDVPPTYQAPVKVGGAEIGDTIFRDWNGNGTQDATDGGLPGVTVNLFTNGGVTPMTSKTTDAEGSYLFTGLAPGSYQVRVGTNVPAGYTLTASPSPPLTNQFTTNVATDEVLLTVDFGYRPGGTGSISGTAFRDLNNNGIFGGSDTGITNVPVFLYYTTNTSTNTVFNPATAALVTNVNTGVSGGYSFSNLATGLNYYLVVGSNAVAISNAFAPNSYTNTTPTALLVTNLSGAVTNQNFGFFGGGTRIGDQVYLDENLNGTFDAGDKTLGDVAVVLSTNGVPIATNTSSPANGEYFFEELPAGTYTVTVDTASPSIPIGYAANVTQYPDIALAAGQSFLTADFGFANYLNKTVNTNYATNGQTITYSLLPRFPTSQLFNNLRVIDPLPTGVSYVANSATNTGGVFGSYSNVAVPAVDGAQAADNTDPLDPIPGITNRLTLSTNLLTVGNSLTVTLNVRASTNLTNFTPVLSGTPSTYSVTGPSPASNTITTNTNGVNFTWTVTPSELGEYIFTANATDSAGTDIPEAKSSSALAIAIGGPDVVAWSLGTNTAPIAAETNIVGAPAGVYAFTGTTNSFRRYGMSSSNWSSLSNFPVSAGAGASLAFATNNNLVYALAGATAPRSFYSYNPTNNTWASLADIGRDIALGGSMVYQPVGGTNFIFALPGASKRIYSYNIAANTWARLQDGAANFGAGSQVVGDGTFLYAANGGNTATFRRYSISANTWANLSNAPGNIGAGGGAARIGNSIYVLRGNSTNSLYAYSITGSNWTTLPNAPGNVTTGGKMTTDGTNLFVFQGGSAAFWRYNVASSNWTTNLTAFPATPTTGSAMVYAPQIGATISYNSSMTASNSLNASNDLVTVTLTLGGNTAMTNVVPTTNPVVTTSNGATATRITGPIPASTNIAAGSSANFVYTYRVFPGTRPGSVTFSGGGTATGVTFPTATANSVLVTPRLTFQATVTNTLTGVITNEAIVADNGNVIGSVPSNDTFTATSGSIGDTVWIDADGNGVQSTNESGLAGVTVDVFTSTNLATPFRSAVTDGSGTYRAYNLPANNYVVRPNAATIPAGFIATTTVPQNVPLAGGQQYNDADFGYQAPAAGGISGQLWVDVNTNGAVDTGELNIPNIPVTLQKPLVTTNSTNWTTLATTNTGTNGAYAFSGLPPGTYGLLVDGGATIFSPYSTNFSGVLSNVTVPTYDPDSTNPPVTTTNFAQVTLTNTNTVLTEQNFGYVWNGSIGQLVWYDFAENGEPNTNNPAPNATLALHVDLNASQEIDPADDYIIAVTTTGDGSPDFPNPPGEGDGFYRFGGLPPGNYVVAISEQEVPSPTSGQINTMVLTTEEYVPVALTSSNMVATNANYGLAEKAQIEGRVFYDPNLNGVFDTGDVPLANVTVIVKDLNGNVVATTTTSATGEYMFLLPAGSYTVEYESADIPPAYTLNTTPTQLLVTAVSGATLFGFDFGVADNGKISGTVFGDVISTNGIQDVGDPGLAGITVANYRVAGGTTNLLSTSVTDASGFYQFSGLPAATNGTNYFIQVETAGIDTNTYKTIPSGFPVGANTNTSSWSTPLNQAQSITNVNWGYPLVPGNFLSVSGKIYKGPGPTYQTNNAPITGVQVTVEVDTTGDGNYDSTYTVTTDPDGNYLVAGIKEGSKVRITVDEDTLPNDAYAITGDPTGGGSPSKTYVINSLTEDNNDNLDFGYDEDFASIAGTVFSDSDGDGNFTPSDTPVPGVTVTLTTAGPDGVLGTADDVVSTTTTDNDGKYLFSNQLPGPFQIVTTPPANYTPIADINGGNPNNITSTLNRGQVLTGQDFLYSGPGSIIGKVLIDTNGDGTGDTPAQGITLTLVDGSGNPVTDGSGNPIIAVTDTNGDYVFPNVPAGTYGVKKTNPPNFRALSDKDGGDPNYITTIVVTDNTQSTGNDFVLQNLKCANTWPNWQSLHSTLANTNVDGNNDGDMQRNLFEYAFCMNPYNGEGSPYCVVASLSNTATEVDLVFSRTLGGATDITYQLQAATNLTTNTTWTTLPIPTNAVTTTNFAEGFETVRIPNIGGVVGLTTNGFVRMKVTLASTNVSENGATETGEVGGWIRTPLTTNNRTFNDPFLACPTWSGTIGTVSGNDISVPVATATGNTNLSFLGTGSDEYYVEILSGPFEGQRFDIAGGGTNTITIDPDNALNSVNPPYNTMLGAPPAGLTNAPFVVRKHRTLQSLFPTNLLVPSPDPTTSSLLQFTAGTTNIITNNTGAGWVSYWFSSVGLFNSWVQVGDSSMTSQMSKVMPPGQGSFLQARTNGTFMLFGKVRANDFVSPLTTGLNLVGGGYPLVQSPVGRVMTRDNGFFATNNFPLADQFMMWAGDTNATMNSYVPYYLLFAVPTQTNRPTLLQWTRNGDGSFINVSSNNFFVPDYSTLIRVRSSLTNYTTPLPWGPGTND